MNILSPQQKPAFLIPLVLTLLALMAIWLASPSNAQQRRRASPESEAGAAQYTEAADKLAEANRWAEAIEAYKLVIRQHPKHGPAYKGLGDAYFNTGKWELALASYKEAVRAAPNDAEAWYDLGYWYNAMGRHGEAFVPLVRATGLDPTFAEAFYGIGYAYQRGSEIEKAVTWFKSALNANPNYGDAYYGLALVYTRLGKSNLADEARKKLLAIDPILAQKLDKEIRRPQSAIAGPLPPITRPEPAQAITEGESKSAAVAQNRSTEIPLRTPPDEARTTSTKAEPANLSAPSEQVSQTPPVSVVANDRAATSAMEQSVARPDLPARQGTETASRQLPQPEPEPLRQVTTAPPLSDPAAPQPARVDGPTQPASTESKVQPATPWPVTAWPAKAKRWALVIGVDNYRDEQSSNWHGSANDARTLSEALIQYAGFPADQVTMLSSDQPLQHQPSAKTIGQSLSSLRGRVPQDGLLLVFFAGHGIERNDRSYLLPSDAPAIDDLSLLEFTTVNVERLKELIRQIGVKQVLLLLDASKNNPTPGRYETDNPMTSNFRSSFNFDLSRREVTSFATLFATTVGQRAYEYRVKKQGYFTWALVEGLRGAAANDKGEVTLAGLVKYLQETVPKYVLRDLGAEKQQVPSAVIEGYKADELVIGLGKKDAP